MSLQAKEHRDEQIKKIPPIDVDCSCLDKGTRKMMLYLINKELKFLKGFPRAWVEGSEYDLNLLKERIESCNLQRRGTTNAQGERVLTEYQAFIKQCATGKEKGGEGKTFKECTEDWKENKNAENPSS